MNRQISSFTAVCLLFTACGGKNSPNSIGNENTDAGGKAPICGDLFCNGDETLESCPEDCRPICGNTLCQKGETLASCPQDCKEFCGDGRCEGVETIQDCRQDCILQCGNGTCDNGETKANCPGDCKIRCGDFECDPDESQATCPADCKAVCGNRQCELPGETYATCQVDCTRPMPETVTILVHGAIISPGKADGKVWDGPSRMIIDSKLAQALAMTLPAGYGAATQFFASSVNGVFEPPDPRGEIGLDVGSGFFEDKKKLPKVGNTFMPKWTNTGWLNVPTSFKPRVEINLMDVDILAHDQIGTAMITWDDIQTAYQLGAEYPAPTHQRGNKTILFVIISVR
ncbi:MAG: hypothetical protein GMKNLPBB_01710 [Myxococcota bacterium]|nr:hypothetical protein [Myxococcota bacterium]